MINMKLTTAILATLAASASHACNCSLPENFGNPVCANLISAALKAEPAAPSASASQTQGQGQSQTANGGNAVANATGGTSKSVSNAASSATASNPGNSQIVAPVTNYAAARIPVSSAFSAALTSGIDTCLGSTSGGAQTGLLGLTLGGTRRDKTCELIKKTHLIMGFSPMAACVYLLNHDGEIALAFKDAGLTCESVTMLPSDPLAELPPIADKAPIPPVANVIPSAPILADIAPIKVKHHKKRKIPVSECKMPK